LSSSSLTRTRNRGEPYIEPGGGFEATSGQYYFLRYFGYGTLMMW